jgi:hypothetical protein
LVSVPSTATSRNLSDFFSTLASSVLLFSNTGSALNRCYLSYGAR